MYRVKPVLSPILDIQDKQDQYHAHVSALNTTASCIDDKKPIPPNRIVYQTKRNTCYLNRIRNVGRDNTKLIAAFERTRSEIGKNSVESLKFNKKEDVGDNKTNWIEELRTMHNRNSVSRSCPSSLQFRAGSPSARPSVIAMRPKKKARLPPMTQPSSPRNEVTPKSETECILFLNSRDTPVTTKKNLAPLPEPTE